MLGRAGLAVVGLAQAEVGIWGELSPRGFYDTFPGIFGQHWVAMLGTYNEHLTRDYAAAELGFAALLFLAATWFDRRVVLAAGIAFLFATVPHFLYHALNTSMMSTSANILSLGSFVLEIVVVAAVMFSVERSRP
jgi:hypothetical protein